MRDDIEKLAESKCHLPPWSAAAKQPLKKSTEKEDEWTKEAQSIQRWLGSQLTEKARQKDWQTSRELRETFLLLSGPSCPSLLWLEIAIVWHLAPVGPSCYKPAVKCDAFCHGCALRLLLLFGCGGIRAGTLGSTVHPKESRFHFPEWNAFWHSSASPWFE